MNKINFRIFSIPFLLVLVLFLVSTLVSSLFLLKELKDESDCKITPLENKVDLKGVLKSGTVGEIKSSDTAESQNNSLPAAVFNTAGVITEIKDDRVIVDSNGSSFNDKVSRELNVLFTDKTIVFVSRDQKVKYEGAGGLQNLRVGNEISIEGAENIRGKTEFIAGTINVLR